MIEWIRHGDVALVRDGRAPGKSLPYRSKGLKTKKVVLAEGEITGHAHTLTSKEGFTTYTDRFSAESEGVSAIELDEPAQLTHQEHATVEVPPGFWLVKRQREFWGQERRVMD